MDALPAPSVTSATTRAAKARPATIDQLGGRVGTSRRGSYPVVVTNNAHGWLCRPPEDGDFDRWQELYRAYAEFYREDQSDKDNALVWSWVRDANNPVGCLLVADQGGRLVGLAHYRPFPRPLAAGTGCYLDDLFVDPGHRGLGAADALLGGVRAIANDRGWGVVRWITADDNHRARAKYDHYATRTMWVTYDMAVV